LLVGVGFSAPACAAGIAHTWYEHDYGSFQSRAYDNGYREGLKHGERDARRGRDFAYAHEDTYRDADKGYRRSYGDRGTYRRIFREGYVAGYTEGYRGSHGRWDRYDRRTTYPAYPPAGSAYPRTTYPRGIGRYSSPAAGVGFRDGYEAGRDDAWDRDPYDPRRVKRYREGDHDYHSRYGARDEYAREYRAAFLQGYEQGYRDYQR
jgi:hypothetical protein